MILSSADSNFKFLFPKIMFPDIVLEKYEPYINRIPGLLVKDPVELFNYAIQSLSIPTINFDPITQIDSPGNTRQYRANIQDTELYERSITISCQTLAGFVNYFMGVEMFKYYYDFKNKATHLPCSFDIHITDEECNIVSTLHFEDILFNSISGLEFNFSSNTVDFKTFDMTFSYNKFEIIINYK